MKEKSLSLSIFNGAECSISFMNISLAASVDVELVVVAVAAATPSSQVTLR